MEDNNKREYDAVLGGQAPPPVNGVVLGGIEGVRRCLENADVNVSSALINRSSAVTI